MGYSAVETTKSAVQGYGKAEQTDHAGTENMPDVIRATVRMPISKYE